MRSLIQLFGHLLSPAAARFQRALAAPEQAQSAVQKQLGDRLIASAYGRSLGICSLADWQRVPIVEYEDLAPWINGGNTPTVPLPTVSGLIPEPILFYEKTSGSCGPVKWIPYTCSLRRSFNHLFSVWAHDLIQHGPHFTTGQLYACLSPQFTAQELDGTPPVALPDDADYLDGWLQWFLRPFLVQPAGLSQLRDPQVFQHQLCLALLKAERLETISIWSPSFLQVQMNYIHNHRQLLRQELGDRLSPDRRQWLADPTQPWTELWPQLKLISCWDRGNAADQAAGLKSQFPGVLVQGKGLLATEAPITLPLIAAQGFVPLLDEVFFEFADSSGNIHLLHELCTGEDYTIVLSQKGGLYRYRIGDWVRVTHWYGSTPCLHFKGRDRAISDLVGEKLHEEFVQKVMAQLPLAGSSFQSLVPIANPPHYVLLLDRAPAPAAEIARQLDDTLGQAYHYRQARLLGQLRSPQVWILAEIPSILAMHRAKNGNPWGGVKHPLLDSRPMDLSLFFELRERLGRLT